MKLVTFYVQKLQEMEMNFQKLVCF